MLALLPEEADALLQALQTEPSVAVRVNRRKAMPPATDDPVAWCRSGIYLDARCIPGATMCRTHRRCLLAMC